MGEREAERGGSEELKNGRKQECKSGQQRRRMRAKGKENWKIRERESRQGAMSEQLDLAWRTSE